MVTGIIDNYEVW